MKLCLFASNSSRRRIPVQAVEEGSLNPEQGCPSNALITRKCECFFLTFEEKIDESLCSPQAPRPGAR